MPASKGRPDLKLEQAARHLDELQQAIDAYRSGSDFHTVTESPTGGAIEFRLRVTTPPPLDQWSLLFGDCVHNIRAALDHLAWQLDSKPDRDTSFPTFTGTPKSWPPLAVSRMDARAQKIIEQLQPYHEAAAGRDVDRHPLATLHKLDISDKHCVLTVTIGALAGNITSGLPFGAETESSIWHEFVDGALVSRVRCPGGPVNTSALECSPSFDAVLVDPPWQSANVTWVLEELLLNWVRTNVVAPLTPFMRP